MTWATPLEGLQRGINDRQFELREVTQALSKHAARKDSFALYSRGAVIVLGAFAATKAAGDQPLGSSSDAALITYTLVGLLITAIAGLEAAFKNEAKAAELKLLAAEALATMREVDTRWQRDIGAGRNSGQDQVEAALALIDLHDMRLMDIQTKAARLGVNITLEVHELTQGRELYPAVDVKRKGTHFDDRKRTHLRDADSLRWPKACGVVRPWATAYPSGAGSP